MSLIQICNGIGSALTERDSERCKAIAEHFNLPLEEVKKVADSCDNMKLNIKPKKRPAKPKEKKERQPSGYSLFCSQNKAAIVETLKNNKKERTFIGKDGKEITLDDSFFKKTDGEPTFAAIVKKMGSMWDQLSKEEVEEYKRRAKEEPIKPKATPKRNAKAGGTQKGDANIEVVKKQLPPSKGKRKADNAGSEASESASESESSKSEKSNKSEKIEKTGKSDNSTSKTLPKKKAVVVSDKKGAKK